MLLFPLKPWSLLLILSGLSACTLWPSDEAPRHQATIESPSAPAPVRDEPPAQRPPDAVDPAKQRLLDRVAAQKRQAGMAQQAQFPADANALNQRLNFTRMLFMGKTGRRVAASEDADVAALFQEAQARLTQAEGHLALGDNQAAEAAIAETMRLFNSAVRLVPNEDLKAQARADYPKLRESLRIIQDAHQRNYERMVTKHDIRAGVMYDTDAVTALVDEAAVLAAANDYLAAEKDLKRAQRIVQAAIREMLNHQEIVYALNIATPADEFSYELNKYLGYEELIPVAIEKQQPNQGQMLLVNRTVEKAKWMAGQARAVAAAQDYAKAIRMVQDATVEIRQALKIMGVPDIG